MNTYKNKTIIFLTILIIVFSDGILAQNFKRGFKLLEKSDYEKAYEVFEKVLEEESENVSSHFGLALIYSDDNFNNKDYITAWEYADFTNKNKNKLTSDELDAISEFYTNTEERRSSRPVNKKIDLSLELILDKLIRHVRESNDVGLVNAVIEHFPDFVYYENTVHIKNYLEYRAVEKQNTIDGYNQFISNFPGAAQIPLAIEKRNTLIFENVKKKNTVVTYNEFINNHPESKFVSEAIRLRNKIAFNDAKQANTVESIELFIYNYPDALEVLDAKIIQKRLIYERAKEIRTLEAYDDFIRKYPDGIQYIDIFNLKAGDLGEKLLQRNKYPSESFQWARVFDNDNGYDEAADLLVDRVTGDIILACNTFEDTSKMMNAWIISLKNNGDMAWNKQIGDNFNDKVEKIKCDKENFYFTGLTRGLNDSILGEPWIFMIKKDGRKVWNRTYKISSIETFDISNQQEILFGSYYGDTTKRYYLTKLTTELKKLWEREYTNPGIVSSVSVLDNNRLLVGGNNWLFQLNSDGYLLWEQYLQNSDSLVALTTNNNSISIAGIRDSLSLFISQFDLNGGKLWDKSIVFEDGIEVSSIKFDGEGNLFFAGTSAADGVLIKLDSKGNILDNLMFGTENNVSFHAISITEDNAVYIAASEDKEAAVNKKDILLLKYTP